MASERVSDALALVLLASAQDLAPLCGWPPAGALIDDVVETIQGRGGVTLWQMRRLRTWARRYQQLHPVLQEWYALHAGSPLASPVLWYVLDHRRAPSNVVYGKLCAMWEHDHGGRPSYDLMPRIP